MILATVFVTLIFLAVTFFVIRPLDGTVRQFGLRIRLDFVTSPFLAVMLLRFLDLLSWPDIWRGVYGSSDGLRPMSIVTIFFTLAYCSISVDLTGVLEAVALAVLNAAGSNPRLVFFFLYLLVSLLTVFTSNDIVILTVTPIVCYFCASNGTEPRPYLFTQFAAANIWSTILYIGNPTNIIAAGANHMTFASYFAQMALPGAAAGVTSLMALYAVFRSQLTTTDTPNPPSRRNPRDAIRDRTGAFFGVFMLALCLVLLVASSWVQLPLWVCTLGCCAIMFLRDVMVPDTPTTHHAMKNEGEEEEEQTPSAIETQQPRFFFFFFSTRAFQVLRRVPWNIAPFVVSMFVLVEALDVNGALELLARALRAVSSLGGFAGIFLTMLLSCIFMATMNNQPATILLTRAMLHSAFKAPMTPALYQNSVNALILASNFGANFSPVGALAGLMWLEILQGKGIVITWMEFSGTLLRVMVPVLGVSSVVLWLSSS